MEACLESISLIFGGHRTVSKYNVVWHNPALTLGCFYDRKIAELQRERGGVTWMKGRGEREEF
jgi:hypothetical protein